MTAGLPDPFGDYGPPLSDRKAAGIHVCGSLPPAAPAAHIVPPSWYASSMTEFGLAILIVGALLITDRERLDWVTAKARELMEWMSS